MKLAFLKVAALFVCALIAGGWFRGSTICPQGGAYADGCIGAPLTNSQTVEQSAFFTSYAQQSLGGGGSQVAPYFTRPAWNVAGVDYPVGPNPVTYKDPTVDALPSPCTLVGSVGNYEVLCTSGVNITFDGWDFSGHGSVYLNIGGAVSGKVLIQNSKFTGGATNTFANAAGLLVSVRPANTAASCIGQTGSNACFVFQNNILDGGASAVANLVQYSGFGSFYGIYNRISNVPARIFTSGAIGLSPFVTDTCEIKYNYIEGITTASNTAHGEVSLWLGICGNALTNFNTILQRASDSCLACDVTAAVAAQIGTTVGSCTACSISGTTLTVSGGTGTFFRGAVVSGVGVTANSVILSGTSPTFTLSQSSSVAAEAMNTTLTLPLSQTNNNTIVVNLFGGVTGGLWGTAIARIQNQARLNYTRVELQNNFVDPTGAFQCYNSGDFTGGNIGTLAQSGDTNLLDGSSIVTASNCFGHH